MDRRTRLLPLKRTNDRERSNFAMVLNYLSPFIYGLFGATITLLAAFIIFHLKIL